MNNNEKCSTDMLQTYLSKTMDERDKAYQQRWEAQEKAVSAALNAAEKAVTTALISQEKAVANAFNAQEKAVASALSAAERAVAKAEASSEKRFDNLNEKIESNNVILDKYELNTKNLVGRLDELREYKDTTSGREKGFNSGWIYLLGFSAFAVSIITLFFKFK
jgi:membrane-associated HD superfamily phosphohydrolase